MPPIGHDPGVDVVGVGPDQVGVGPVVRDFHVAVDGPDLVDGFDLRGQPPVHAEDLAVDDRAWPLAGPWEEALPIGSTSKTSMKGILSVLPSRTC